MLLRSRLAARPCGAFSTVPILLCSGVLTSILLIDDAFLLHEEVFPNLLGVPQNTVFSVYFVVIGAYLMYFSRHILTTDYLLLAAALLCFGSSLFTDIAVPDSGVRLFVEDGLKFFGIALWLGYFAHTAFVAIRREERPLGA